MNEFTVVLIFPETGAEPLDRCATLEDAAAVLNRELTRPEGFWVTVPTGGYVTDSNGKIVIE